ncbi:MAG: hypothetical protein CVV41_14570 [Candidatus Riflebacteria bacterium HGW-Riflebacteria-1]|nr:MAG: hypothetical protein CVV41_14570 [Candidatus Riflebacteria bacterium HGW-Riflebacteria-1]
MQAFIRRGFSLVELMIAFALTVFVIGLALYFFSQANANAEDISKKQHLLNVASSLLRVIKKDLRSATEAQVSFRGICLRVNQLKDETGAPESKLVDYEISAGEIIRSEDGFTKPFSFSSLLKPDDYLSLSITQNNPAGSGFFLEIFAANSGGVELIRLRERLIKVDMTKP